MASLRTGPLKTPLGFFASQCADSSKWQRPIDLPTDTIGEQKKSVVSRLGPEFDEEIAFFQRAFFERPLKISRKTPVMDRPKQVRGSAPEKIASSEVDYFSSRWGLESFHGLPGHALPGLGRMIEKERAMSMPKERVVVLRFGAPDAQRLVRFPGIK